MIRQGTNILKEHAKNRLEFKPDLQQINFLNSRVYKRDEDVFYPLQLSSNICQKISFLTIG